MMLMKQNHTRTAISTSQSNVAPTRAFMPHQRRAQPVLSTRYPQVHRTVPSGNPASMRVVSLRRPQWHRTLLASIGPIRILTGFSGRVISITS